MFLIFLGLKTGSGRPLLTLIPNTLIWNPWTSCGPLVVWTYRGSADTPMWMVTWKWFFFWQTKASSAGEKLKPLSVSTWYAGEDLEHSNNCSSPLELELRRGCWCTHSFWKLPSYRQLQSPGRYWSHVSIWEPPRPCPGTVRGPRVPSPSQHDMSTAVNESSDSDLLLFLLWVQLDEDDIHFQLESNVSFLYFSCCFCSKSAPTHVRSMTDLHHQLHCCV